MKLRHYLLPTTALCLMFAAGFSAGRVRSVDLPGEAPPSKPIAPAPVSAADSAVWETQEPGEPARAAQVDAAPPIASRDMSESDSFLSGIDPRLAQAYLGSGGDPSQAVDLVLSTLDEREIISTLTTLTNTTPEDLSEIRDVRDYARRLANIAMDGVLADPTAEADLAPVPDVMFTNSVDPDGFPAEVRASFGTDTQDRIYAVFPSEKYTRDQVLVKWFREGESNLMLFGRYPVRPGEPLNHVWVERDGGWRPGPYVVEFYNPSEPLTRIAAGRFEVSAN